MNITKTFHNFKDLSEIISYSFTVQTCQLQSMWSFVISH